MFLEPVNSSMTSPIVIPGLSSGKRDKKAGQLLRRPQAPRKLPPLISGGAHELSEKNKSSLTEKNPFADVFDMFDLKSEEEEQLVPHPSGAPSLVSSSSSSELVLEKDSCPLHSQVSTMMPFAPAGEEKFILDPRFREGTNLGTYVDGRSLKRPVKPRGPDAFPPRVQKQIRDIVLDFENDDIRFYQPPAFTLDYFVRAVSERRHIPLRQVQEIVHSRHNVKRLTDLLINEKINPCTQTKINTIQLDPQEKNVPLCEPRTPQHQLLLEMAALIKQHVQQHGRSDVRTVIKRATCFSPSRCAGGSLSVPHTEIILYEDDALGRESVATALKQESEAPGIDAMIHSSRSRYFQDSSRGRSQSPFAPPYDSLIAPSELAILDSIIASGRALSLKAHFVETLPDISPMSRTLVYLNLSFNNFKNLPPEILDIWQLEVLKLRDNPLVELPEDIERLYNLRVLVASFCLLTTLPQGLFTLQYLEHLNVAYNKLTFIPNEIRFLQKLRELDVEGNILPALPVGVLQLHLQVIRVKNNLMHPLFWKEHTHKESQRLTDLCMLHLHRCGFISQDIGQLPELVQRALKTQEICDCCQGPRYGPGLRMIRPVPKLFEVRHLPILFQVCTPTCFQAFRSMGVQQLVQCLYGVDTSG